MIDRFGILDGILTVAKLCLGNCDYEFVIARALPPGDACHVISVNWVDSRLSPFGDCSSGLVGCGGGTEDHVIRIGITRYCPGPDVGTAGGVFDFAAEQLEAECFYRDVSLIESCLDCEDYENMMQNFKINKIVRMGTRFDDEVVGGYASAYIDVMISAEVCCP